MPQDVFTSRRVFIKDKSRRRDLRWSGHCRRNEIVLGAQRHASIAQASAYAGVIPSRYQTDRRGPRQTPSCPQHYLSNTEALRK
jgi:hypothetical protein